jgi:hypothetical protein
MTVSIEAGESKELIESTVVVTWQHQGRDTILYPYTEDDDDSDAFY